MGSSLSKSHLPRNYWPEETGQVTTNDIGLLPDPKVSFECL